MRERYGGSYLKKFCFVIILALMISSFPGAGAISLSAEPVNQDFDGYIVKLKDVSGPRLFSNLLGDLEEVYTEANLYKTSDPAQIAALEEYGLVEYAEPNYKAYLMGVVNDPYYSMQWNLSNIGVESAWDMELRGEGIRVAVVDSGINALHEEFADVNITEGESFIKGVNDVNDNNGHGTFIAGVIAAAANNGKGIAGMTDKVTIIPLKCFTSTNEASLIDIINAIYRAVDYHDADIINLSLGTANNLNSFRDAIAYADSRNVLVVSAVGNEHNTTLFYPAAYDTVIGVSSIDQNGNHSDFSQVNSSVFVTAPGEAIASLGVASSKSYSEGSGTSYSVPHVTALAAMAFDYNPKLTTAQIRDIFAASAVDLGSPGYDEYFGYGRVDAKSFLQELLTYGNGNTAPVAVNKRYSAQIVLPQSPTPFSFDMSGWFEDEEGGNLNYSIYSATTLGELNIDGSRLIYVPDSADADKHVRIVISANDGELTSEINAVLTVSVASEVGAEDSLNDFVDLSGHWSRKYAAFAVSGELMNGIDATRFAPDLELSRAMFVTILGRLSGEDLTGYSHSFEDVSDGWYSDSVAWASANGIISGTAPGQFNPDANVTRQEIMVILYRYAVLFGINGEQGGDGVYYGYNDTDKIADWAADAMLWAVSNGIVSGKSDTTLEPVGNASRAEAAAILLRFVNTFVL